MFSFELDENEKLVHMQRQAESTLLKPAALVLVLLYLPIWYLLKYDLLQQFSLYLGIWTFAVCVYAVRKYLLWLINTYIVTTRRVVHIHYHSFFKKTIEEILISDIANIRITTGGFGHLLSQGTLEVDGAGTRALFIEKIKDAHALKEMLWKLKEKKAVVQKTLGPIVADRKSSKVKSL